MIPSLWQVAAGLGVGAFVAALFYGIVRRFGRHKGEGFETSKLDPQATAIIAVLIVLIAGACTITALIIYSPSRTSSTNEPVDDDDNLYAYTVAELGINPFDWTALDRQWSAWVDALRKSGDSLPELTATEFFRRVAWSWISDAIQAHAKTLRGKDLEAFRARTNIYTASLAYDKSVTSTKEFGLTNTRPYTTTYWEGARAIGNRSEVFPSNYWYNHKQRVVDTAREVLKTIEGDESGGP